MKSLARMMSPANENDGTLRALTRWMDTAIMHSSSIVAGVA
jgi:hypothetical protein